MIGDDTATQYFQINDTTGVVSLRQSVLPDTLDQYRVSYMTVIITSTKYLLRI